MFLAVDEFRRLGRCQTMSEVKEIKSIQDLIPDDLNANKGTLRGRGMIEDSLSKLGAGRSVLADKNGKLIAGNKTAEVAAEIGLDDIVVVQSDGKKLIVVQRTDLDLDADKEARQLAVLDNRTSEVSLHWDAQALQEMENRGIDLSDAFDRAEMENIIALSEQNSMNALNAEAPEEFPAYDENLDTEYRCPKCSYSWSGKAK